VAQEWINQREIDGFGNPKMGTLKMGHSWTTGPKLYLYRFCPGSCGVDEVHMEKR